MIRILVVALICLWNWSALAVTPEQYIADLQNRMRSEFCKQGMSTVEFQTYKPCGEAGSTPNGPWLQCSYRIDKVNAAIAKYNEWVLKCRASFQKVDSKASGGFANLRSGPGQGHGVVTQVPAGADIRQTGNCRAADDGKSKHEWCEYSFNGRSGWMSKGVVASQTPEPKEVFGADLHPQMTANADKRWAAIAVSQRGKAWGMEENSESPEDAQESALRNCSRNASGCRTLGAFSGECRAVSWCRDGNHGYWWDRGSTQSEAESGALRQCRNHHRHDCFILKTVCQK